MIAKMKAKQKNFLTSTKTQNAAEADEETKEATTNTSALSCALC